MHRGDVRQVIDTKSLLRMKFLVSHSPMSPQPSLNNALSYPVLGALPLIGNLYKILLALVPETALALTELDILWPRPKTRAIAIELAANFLESCLALENFNNLVEESVNLVFCIAASF